MNAAELRQVASDPARSPLDRIEASRLLALASDATADDLLTCVKCRGVVGELAALGLYNRTGRPKPRKLRDYANPDLWEQFLVGWQQSGSQPWHPPPAAAGAA